MLKPIITTQLDAAESYHYYILAHGRCHTPYPDKGPMYWQAILQTADGRAKRIPETDSASFILPTNGDTKQAQLHANINALNDLAHSLRAAKADPRDFSLCVFTTSARIANYMQGKKKPPQDLPLQQKLEALSASWNDGWGARYIYVDPHTADQILGNEA